MLKIAQGQHKTVDFLPLHPGKGAIDGPTHEKVLIDFCDDTMNFQTMCQNKYSESHPFSVD